MFLLSTRSIPDDLSEDRLAEFIMIEFLRNEEEDNFTTCRDSPIPRRTLRSVPTGCAVSGPSTAGAMSLLSSGVTHFAWDSFYTPTQPSFIAIEDKDTSISEEESRIGG